MKRVSVILSIVAVALLLVGNVHSGEQSQWRMWQLFGEIRKDPMCQRWVFPPLDYEQTSQRIFERSGKRLKINVMTPHELGLKGTELFRALKDGLIEVGEIVFPYVSAEVPWVGIVDLPYIIQDTYNDHPKLIELIRPDFEKLCAEYDTTLLAINRMFPNPVTAVYTKKPIKSLKDLKGLKLRVMSPYHRGVLEKAGAVPVFMPWAEVHMAIKTGVLDGLATSIGLSWLYKMNEMGISHETPLWPIPITNAIVVSNKALKALPKDLQEIVLDEWRTFYVNRKDATVYNVLFANENNQLDVQQGMTIAPKNPEIWQALEGYAKETDWNAYEKKAGPKGEEMLQRVLETFSRKRHGS